jgi:hypothetical protein
MAKAKRKAAPKRKATRKTHRGPGRPRGYKCSAATKKKMSAARTSWWRKHKRGGGRKKAGRRR